jgi:hypothetical protein
MALQITITDEADVTHTDSYHFITSITLRRRIDHAAIKVSAYKSQAAKNSGKRAIATHLVTVTGADYDTYYGPAALNPLGKNVYKQSYEYLKTIDPEEVNSKHPDFPYDYKNDSIDV